MAQNSKIWGVEKKVNFLTSQKSALFGLANGQSVTYLKIQTKVFRVPSGTPMDWFLMKSVNAKYPLSCRKCVKKQPRQTPQVCRSPPEMVPPYSPGSCPPKILQNTLMPCHSFIEKKLIFWRPYILTKVLKRPWSRQKLTYVKMGQKGS